jgi:hypothetical protein
LSSKVDRTELAIWPLVTLQLFRVESERLKLPTPFSRRIAQPFDADAAGQATERANSTEPVPRPGSPAPGSIGWICKFAFVNRKTSASDALRKSCPETLKLGDPLIDPFRPFPRKARPVLAGGNTTRRKLGEFHTDFLKGQPDPLREDNKGNTAKHRSGIAPMP